MSFTIYRQYMAQTRQYSQTCTTFFICEQLRKVIQQKAISTAITIQSQVSSLVNRVSNYINEIILNVHGVCVRAQVRL